MTIFGALVSVAGQEFLTDTLADGDLIRAFSTFLSQKGYYFSTSTWTILDLIRCLLAALTRSLMTDLLTLMLPTVELLSAYVVTHEFFASTFDYALRTPAETLYFHIYITFLTLSRMTLLLAVMSETVKYLAALALTREVASRCD